MRSLRILYVGSRFPIPARGGREKMILQSLSIFSNLGEVDFFYFEKNDPSIDAQKKVKSLVKGKLVRLSIPSVLDFIVSILLLRASSFQQALFFSNKNKSILIESVSFGGYDIVVYDMLRVGQYRQFIKQRGVSHILEMDDLLSKRYARIINYEGSQGNLFGSFSSKFPILSALVPRHLTNFLLSMERRFIFRQECLSVNNFDLVTLTSPLEVDELIVATQKRNVISNPPGVSIFSGQARAERNGNFRTLFFSGNLKVAHNFASLKYVIEEVLIFSEKYYLDGIELLVVGDFNQEDVSRLKIPRNVSVRFLGYVDDMAEYIDMAVAALVPITFGTGIKLKIVDAMSRGVPVITNSIGLEGIPAVNGESVLVSDSPEMLFQYVKLIFEDSSTANRIGSGGLGVVDRYFNIDSIRQQIVNVSKDLVQSRLH